MADPQNGFDELLDRYLTNRLTEGDAERLLARLRSHPDLSAELLDQLTLDALLRDLAGHPTPALPAQLAPSSAANRRPVPWVVAGAAVAVSLLLFFRASVPQVEPPLATAEEPTTTAVAVLTRSVGAHWTDPPGGVTVGAALTPGWLKLESGLAEIEFYRGARVVVEGPAEVQLVSADRAACRFGRLTAEVPPAAAGFQVGTPHGAVIDRGTAFGLNVTAGGTEVHVFEGQIELHGASGRRTLATGQAVAVAPGAADRPLVADRAGFVTRGELDQREDADARRARERWATASRAWNAEPALLARFDFEGRLDRNLPNVANRTGVVPDGTVVGCSRAEGRWSEKGGLEFGRIGDRVRLTIPGELRSLTLLATVRVSGLDRRFNSLLMSDAFDPGAVHWQILTDGRVRLGIAGHRGHADYDSAPVVTPDRFGRWLPLAVVYDADVRRVTHFADGVPVGHAVLKFETPLRPGRAELGNWNPASRADAVPIRHFSGRMDEFSIVARALTADEVRWRANADPPTPKR
ncbi:MAG TPA: LamG-like jellyroll fold domain-containing protein [Gemmata sp.]